MRFCIWWLGLAGMFLVWRPGVPLAESTPYVVVLGIAQDGSVPQAGDKDGARWENPQVRRYVASLAIVDPATSSRWLIDCTPDFPLQLHELDKIAPVSSRPGINGVFLTHAHMGHYTGLMHLGHESMGAKGVPVYAMPRMAEFLRTNGPWSQLVSYKNIVLEELEAGKSVAITSTISVEPFIVPHRQEFSEVVGYRITGPNRSVVFIPDIDSWEEWDAMGWRIEDVIRSVDVAYLDGTFFANGEIPGRDMSGFPHPFIVHSMERFAKLPEEERAKVRFIHLNHTNAALFSHHNAYKTIVREGFRVAEELERVGL
ncbi:MAG: MBL fold metallo-hydrolase [bacterium]|nr:MBL fold metallo-hydrolase [bacterium]